MQTKKNFNYDFSDYNDSFIATLKKNHEKYF
ncbi:Uncharacterised protein [Mesomycoplasma neurolyticum]|uniref:Uncharacterized protein n=1 Tax=Mesomycoplasma neurolyticum TaxID=2120 RepID=A0A449A4D3_9BACT|nr:Uncharacterised protein [Mesomycoplasma neurolyticum]